MPAGTLFATVDAHLLGMTPIGMTEIVIIASIGVFLPALVIWLVMRGKSKRQKVESDTQLDQLRASSEAALKAEQARAATQAAEAKTAADAVAAKLADTEQRFATHREVSDRRANDASQQISRLEADLAATRQIAAQLPPTQSRIKDLETALAAEQGRVQAQEQAITATNARAADFEQRLAEAQELVMRHKSEMHGVEGELRKVRAEQAAYAAAGGPEAELAKAREATQQAEAKIAQLQKTLKATEARVEMVQKEFMNAVGLASAPVPGVAAPAASTDKKVRDLEEKLTHLEAESRKRAREDGYKIAELEYRLSEALEAAKQPAAEVKPAPAVAAPAVAAPAVAAPAVAAPAVAAPAVAAPAVAAPAVAAPAVAAPAVAAPAVAAPAVAEPLAAAMATTEIIQQLAVDSPLPAAVTAPADVPVETNPVDDTAVESGSTPS